MNKFLVFLTFLAATSFRAGAVVSEPDNVVYGTITLGGVQILASNTNIFVAARLTSSGPPIDTYTMGAVPSVGNDYSLRITVEAIPPVSAANIVTNGQSIYLDVDDQYGIRAQTTFTVGAPGQMTLLNFNGPNTGETVFPADNNPTDNSVSISEVVAYTLAWREGTPWPAAPTVIPVSYAVKAGSLWRGGGAYAINGSIGSAPAWWINVNASPSFPPASQDSAASTMPTTFIPGQPMTVSDAITPASGVGTYAVEDQPPPGWTVANINNGGAYDSVNGKVKWGLFFDNNPRVLSYQATPPVNAVGLAAFAGTVSYDGSVTTNISGQRFTSYQPTPTFGLASFGLGTSFHINLKGSPGETFMIYQSTDLIEWETVATLVIDSSENGDFYVPVTNQASFYRVSLQP